MTIPTPSPSAGGTPPAAASAGKPVAPPNWKIFDARFRWVILQEMRGLGETPFHANKDLFYAKIRELTYAALAESSQDQGQSPEQADLAAVKIAAQRFARKMLEDARNP